MARVLELHPGMSAPAVRLAVRHARAVLPDRILEDATLVSEGGVIVELGESMPAPEDAIDARQAYLLPGLIDTHSDALEREINPRPGSHFPPEFALRSLEGRLKAAGTFTAFTGIGFQENSNYGRSIELARSLCSLLQDRRASGSAGVEHHILYRLDARTPTGLDAMLDCLGDTSRALVSIEDHTPGQGQFRNLDALRVQYRGSGRGASDEEVDAIIQQRIQERDQLLPHVERNREVLSAMALQGRITLLAHDLEDAAQTYEAAEIGSCVSEFPLSLEAARAAHERDMLVVMGAPNVVRGGSLAGNISAAKLVSQGLCDALASDYQPATLLAAAFRLATEGIVSLPDAVGLITRGPAEVGRLDDRGELALGKRADLLLVDMDNGWPVVRWSSQAPFAQPTTAER
jgi:alpha-D-ribose 1-methylphosphonate 5-triphosphate diphosphatase